MTAKLARYRVSGSAGSKDGKNYAVIDSHNQRRVSFHKTIAEAKARAKELNQGGRS